MMDDITISTIALSLCLAPALVHGVEVVKPIWASWVVNGVLPFFAPGLPRKSGQITEKEQLEMLDAALEFLPEEKKTSGKDYIFLLLFEQRQGALAFIAVFAAAVYAMGLPLADRHALHLLFLTMSALFALVNANQAGVSFLGHHPRVSKNGRNVGIVFSLFWIVSAMLNYLAFQSSAI